MSVASDVRIRPATRADIPGLATMAGAAIEALLGPLLDEAELTACRRLMGIDAALVDDGTYFVAEVGGEVAGCGGWSRRGTFYGDEQSPGRPSGTPTWLDPRTDAARIRAMYTSPTFARRGVGRAVLDAATEAAAAAGFGRVELLATAAGKLLYEDCGFVAVEHVVETAGGAPVDLVRMQKRLAPAQMPAARTDDSASAVAAA